MNFRVMYHTNTLFVPILPHALAAAYPHPPHVPIVAEVDKLLKIGHQPRRRAHRLGEAVEGAKGHIDEDRVCLLYTSDAADE